MRLTMLYTCAAVFALASGGCGGSGTLSRADFTQKANAVCRQATKTASARRGSAATGIAEAFFTLERSKAEGIGALKPPKELQSRVGHYVNAITSLRELFHQVIAAGHARHSVAAIASRTPSLIHREEVLAAQLGLQACVERTSHGKSAY